MLKKNSLKTEFAGSIGEEDSTVNVVEQATF
jgi:hypothetical protein